MKLTLIPTMERPAPLALPDSSFHALPTLSRAELADTRDLTAAERRQLAQAFVQTFAWEAVRPLLPLRLAQSVPPTAPIWRARDCRSHYVWLPPDDVLAPAAWLGLDNFDLVVRLFDFSPWRPILGQRFSRTWDHLLSTRSASAWLG
jgi:hypothetical protein